MSSFSVEVGTPLFRVATLRLSNSAPSSIPDDTFLLWYVVSTTTHPPSEGNPPASLDEEKASQTDASGNLIFSFIFHHTLSLDQPGR